MIRITGRIRPAVVATMIALVLGGVLSPAGDSVAASSVSALARNGNSWTGVWRGNDGGVYYLREDASGGLVWLGLSGDGGKSWSNVFTGTIGGSDRNLVVGPWVDVPIGTVRGQGELGLTRKDPNLIVAHRRTGGFGGSEWRRLGSDPLQNVQSGSQPPPPPGESLTGTWKGNDGGTYYLREHRGYAGLRQITWVGLDGGGGKGWSNVFFGSFDPYERDGKTISGPWTDVPRGSARGGGNLRLRLADNNRIVATDHAGFGGSEWRRARPIRALGRARMSREEQSLFDLVNDARTHPEKYPPNGNTQGAVMKPCPGPFQYSQQLRDIAREHNRFLASKPIDWVNADSNMHTGPSGKLVWDPGEPMDRAGYHTFRAENVATGFATAAEVMRFWMQDDERFGWGHRNLILNCDAREAGIGHHAGGPGGHYWTLDVGTK